LGLLAVGVTALLVNRRRKLPETAVFRPIPAGICIRIHPEMTGFL
jgi:hypothetical protein